MPGNAKIAGKLAQVPHDRADEPYLHIGLEKDLGLIGFDYNIALTVFYVAVCYTSFYNKPNAPDYGRQYITVEVPSNLALKHFGSTWLAFLIIGFGATSISTAFIQNFGGLIVTRIVLGFTEGGLLPGLVYVLSRVCIS